MIDRTRLLHDLRLVVRDLEQDLRERSDSDEVPDIRRTLRSEFQRARDAERTAQSFEEWRDDAITQAAAAWALSCVFVRFLEDNRLIDPPRIAGPATRLARARDEHELYFRAHPTQTDRDYLLHVFRDLARLPGVAELFGEHNPIGELPNWLSGDAAGELLRFFQKIDPGTGALVHEFTAAEGGAAGTAAEGGATGTAAEGGATGGRSVAPPSAAVGRKAPYGSASDRPPAAPASPPVPVAPPSAAVRPAAPASVPIATGYGLGTRFLGDLYQDLSEAARKKYALLQTPEFVEEFILDRTLDPAIEEFGLAGFRMIDPACGSGHFLLGSFHRLLDRWQRREPGTNVRELARRALESVHGVDLNPYAVAIARFRLLVAAMRACGITRLIDAPNFPLHLACGDSLLHGSSQRLMDVLLLPGQAQAHAYASEDLEQLKRLLEPGRYHAVVANPPYITPKDPGLNAGYRKRFTACHMKYSLAAPFMEQLFRLAVRGASGHATVPAPKGREMLARGATPGHVDRQPTTAPAPKGREMVARGATPGTATAGPAARTPAGYVGQITANSFMKREFGKKLIEEFLPTVDLTHVIDTSGAYIPGHGTPTVILFGRNRKPVASTIRTVMGIRGEPATPEDPAQAKVWSAILDQVDIPGSASPFVSVTDSPRAAFLRHPWSIGGGGAAELKEVIDRSESRILGEVVESIGFASFTGSDDVFIMDCPALQRKRCERTYIRGFVYGEVVRDYSVDDDLYALAPYGANYRLGDYVAVEGWARHLWPHRTCIRAVVSFGGKTRADMGDAWWGWYRWIPEKYLIPLSITFAEVATHNHFVLDTGGKVFKQTAPVIKLPAGAGEDEHLAILGALNSSVACFWLKQVCHNKGSTVDLQGARQRTSPFEDFFAFNGTKLQQFPLPPSPPLDLARQLHTLGRHLQALSPAGWIPASAGAAVVADAANFRREWEATHQRMIALQEELDWQCYRLVELLDEELTCHGEARPTTGTEAGTLPNSEPPPLALGQRAFEVVMARRMAAGELETTWFARHGSTPITELPADWPPDYGRLVERRIAAIESDRNIALIEQPEYKRRWNTETWESQLARALRTWLLDRLERWFDFDGRMNDSGAASSMAPGATPGGPGVSPQATISRPFGAGDGGVGVGEGPGVAPLAAISRPFGAGDGGVGVGDGPGVAPLATISRPFGAGDGDEAQPRLEVALVSVGRLADLARQDAGFQAVAALYRDDPAFDVLALVEELVLAESVPLLPALRYTASGRDKRAAWERTWELQRREDAIDARMGTAVEGGATGGRSVAPPSAAVSAAGAEALKRREVGDIPVPPKYASADFQSVVYWRLRGKLDVPKERWVSFPHCEGPDGTLMIAWAGYDHLQLAQCVSAYYVDVQERLGGREDPRLSPLLAALIELLPWLAQWHNDLDPHYAVRMGDYYEGFVQDEARQMGRTVEEARAWEPPAGARGRTGRGRR